MNIPNIETPRGRFKKMPPNLPTQYIPTQTMYIFPPLVHDNYASTICVHLIVQNTSLISSTSEIQKRCSDRSRQE